MNSNIGSVKLYHRSGAAVKLPVAGDASAMHAAVDDYLAAGFTVALPGMEAGEQMEMASHVIRGRVSKDGKTTPYILLYSPKPELKHSFLKVYLNTEAMVFDFEYASKLRLGNIPVYVGKDKPERGKDPDTDREFLVAAPKPFGVLFRDNPRWSQEAADAAKQKNEIYAVPRRVFVRWADQRPEGDAPQARQTDPRLQSGSAPMDVEAIRAKWKQMIGSNPPVDAFNRFAAANWPDVPESMRGALQSAIRGLASKNGWTWDGHQYVAADDGSVPF